MFLSLYMYIYIYVCVWSDGIWCDICICCVFAVFANIAACAKLWAVSPLIAPVPRTARILGDHSLWPWWCWWCHWNINSFNFHETQHIGASRTFNDGLKSLRISKHRLSALHVWAAVHLKRSGYGDFCQRMGLTKQTGNYMGIFLNLSSYIRMSDVSSFL